MGQYSFSDNLRRKRREKKLSQKDLADRVGVSQKTISAWELNERYPTLDKVYDLASTLHIDIKELICLQKKLSKRE